MKDLQSVLKLLIAAIAAGIVLAAVVSGRAAVREYYAYETMVAPRTLHQMVMEMEAEEESDRTGMMLYGAGLFAMAALAFGGFLFAMHDGRALLRERRLGRRKQRRAQRPEATALPHAPTAPLLRDAFTTGENYANNKNRR